jgi:hypothetical protein
MFSNEISETYHEAMEFIRKNFGKDIDKPYEYFWEEEFPEEFLNGIALDLGFMNFEDWLLCDYRPIPKKLDGKDFVAEIIANIDTKDSLKEQLKQMRASHISLYEVITSADESVIKDIATGEEIKVESQVIKDLPAGEMVGTRVIDINGTPTLGKCLYPFGSNKKDKVLALLDTMYTRFKKTVKEDATLEEFLIAESYTINTIWVSSLGM